MSNPSCRCRKQKAVPASAAESLRKLKTYRCRRIANLHQLHASERLRVRLRMVEGPQAHRCTSVSAAGLVRLVQRTEVDGKEGLGTIAPLHNVATYQSRHTLVLFSLHAAGRAETRRSLRKSGNTIWRFRWPRTRCPYRFRVIFQLRFGYEKTKILRSPRRFDGGQDHFADGCRLP
jgi:hypothetical protein